MVMDLSAPMPLPIRWSSRFLRCLMAWSIRFLWSHEEHTYQGPGGPPGADSLAANRTQPRHPRAAGEVSDAANDAAQAQPMARHHRNRRTGPLGCVLTSSKRSRTAILEFLGYPDLPPFG